MEDKFGYTASCGSRWDPDDWEGRIERREGGVDSRVSGRGWCADALKPPDQRGEECIEGRQFSPFQSLTNGSWPALVNNRFHRAVGACHDDSGPYGSFAPKVRLDASNVDGPDVQSFIGLIYPQKGDVERVARGPLILEGAEHVRDAQHNLSVALRGSEKCYI